MKKSNKHSLEIKKVEEDSRGCVYSGNFNGKEFMIFSLKKGSPKGGHYHNLETVHLILYGSLKLRTKELKEKEKIVKAEDMVIIKPNVIHLFTALEDSLILEFRRKGLETVDYQLYRKLVNDFIKKIQ